MNREQWKNIAALVGLVALGVTSHWWAPLFDAYWRGVFFGMASTYLIMRIKVRELERRLSPRRPTRSSAP